MLRTVFATRAQPAARNLLLVTKRFQQSSASSGSSSTQSKTSNASSAPKTQNAPADRSSNPQKPTTPPPSTKPPSSSSSSASYPSSGGSGGTGKAIVYGIVLGLGVTLLYAEYDNNTFRRKVESMIPLSSTILSGLDKIIDPVFGRHKRLTDIISEKMPDISVVTDKLPDKDQIQKTGEKAKDAINDAYDKLPEYKKVKGAVIHAADQAKDAAHSVRDTVSHAADKAKDAAKSVRDALPQTKGVSGELSRRGNDPVFLEEAGEVATPPPRKIK